MQRNGVGKAARPAALGSSLQQEQQHQPQQQQFPSFAVWQARQLWSREVFFSVVLLLTLFLYFGRTVPELCAAAQGPSSCRQLLAGNVHRDPAAPQLRCCAWYQVMLRSFICGQHPNDLAHAASLDSSSRSSHCSAGNAEQCKAEPELAAGASAAALQLRGVRLAVAVAAKLGSPLLFIVRALVTFFCVGIISCDAFHMVMPPLRIGLLLLLLLPLPLPHLPALWHSAAAAVARRRRNSRQQHSSRRTNTSSATVDSSSSSWVWWYTPDLWWQQPVIRQVVLTVQRVLPPLAAAVVVVAPHSYLYFSYSNLGRFIYQGWVQYMLVLPLPLHLATSVLEWLLSYTTILRLEAAYNAANNMTATAGAFDTSSNSNASSSSISSMWSWLNLWHLLTSLLCVVLLPTLGVARLQQQQRAAYNRIKAAHDQESRQQQQQQGEEPPAARAVGSDACTAKTTSPAAKLKLKPSQPQQQQRHFIDDSCFGMHPVSPKHTTISTRSTTDASAQFLDTDPSHPSPCGVNAEQREGLDDQACPAGASSEVHPRKGKKQRLPCARRDSAAEQFLADIESSMALTTPAAAADMQASNEQMHPPYLSGLMPRISSLLGEEGAAAVFLAAAAAAAPAGPGCPGAAMPYYSSMTQAMPASIKVHTAHRATANLAPTLNNCLATGLAGMVSSSSAPMQIAAACFPGCVQLLANVFAVNLDPAMGASSSSSSSTAAAVLSDVCGALLSLGEGLPDVDVAVGPAAASTQGTPAAAATALLAAAPQRATTLLPSPAVAKETGSSSSSSGDAMQLPLQCFEPACLTAGKPQQQLALQLQQPQDGLRCRLIAFQDGAVVVDCEVTPQGSSISVELPELPIGVLHVALLPLSLNKTQQQQQQHSTICKPPVRQVAPAASAAPLLLAPLLVLPAAAAQELQQHWKQAAAAAAGDNADASNLAEAWGETIASVSTDVAFLLSACKGPAAAAADGKLADGIAAVLQQLLTHLAANGMFATMQLLVEAAAGYAAAAPAAAAAEQLAAKANASKAVVPRHDGSSSGASEAHECSSSSSSSSVCLKPAAAAAAAAAPASSAGRNLAAVVVPASSLLWGFKNQQLEDSYQAAAFSSSRPLDVAALVHSSLIGLGCYYARTGSDSQQQQQVPVVDPGLLFRSQVVVLIVAAGGPLAVQVLRWRVARKLQALQQGEDSKINQGSSSTSTRSSANLAAAELAAAGRLKQRLLICWTVAVLLWCGLLVAESPLILEPTMVTKYWTQRGVAEDFGSLLSYVIKACVRQVPFCWFAPLLAVDVLINVAGCINKGLQPGWWLLPRYSACLLLPLAVAAVLQVHKRRLFCTRQGIAVAGRIPVLPGF